IVAGSLARKAYNDYLIEKKNERRLYLMAQIKNEFDRYFRDGGSWPTEVAVDGEKLGIEYALNTELEDYIKKIISRYRSAHVSVVVMDNDSGHLLASLGHSYKTDEFGPILPFTATHPAASLFKIVTAADLLENTPVTEDSRFKFHGRGTTLYRRQLERTSDRWARYQSLEKAFALSNNVIFGKAAINKLNGESLLKMAYNFGFNRDIMDEVNLSRSVLEMSENECNLAELASGFNRETLIAPMHAAAVSATVANDGQVVKPRLIRRIYAKDTNEDIRVASRSSYDVLSAEQSCALKQM